MSIQNLINSELDRLDALTAHLRKTGITGHGIEDVRSAIQTVESVSSNLRTVVNGVEAEGIEELDGFVDGLTGDEKLPADDAGSVQDQQ